MSDTQISRLEPETLNRVIDALVNAGVAANESDRRFEVQDIQTSIDALEERLRATTYSGGNLSVGTLVHPHDDVDVLVYDSDRYHGLDQAALAWEGDYHARWHRRVTLRVDDWLKRLNGLRRLMSDWLKAVPDFTSLEFFDLPRIPMSEELMRRFDVPSTTMPVFELRDGSKRVMRVQPKGLWIIGANGRVDLTTRSTSRIIVDKSEPLATESLWRMYDLPKRRDSVPFTAETFKELICSSLR